MARTLMSHSRNLAAGRQVSVKCGEIQAERSVRRRQSLEKANGEREAIRSPFTDSPFTAVQHTDAAWNARLFSAPPKNSS